MKDGVFYLFFIDNVTDKKDGSGTPVSGYMPRGYNAGFIYDGGSEHTIAHELGHGIAGLEHVFENSNASGKTANLMDYANGDELWHFQWDQIQDPSRVWMKWNKAEGEGESIEKLNPLICFKIKGNTTEEYEYENGGLFATMHTNDKITIEILSKDTTLNLKKITWLFDKNKLASTDSLNNKVELTLDEKTISLKGNSLSVKDSLNKEIASLNLQAYLPPYVEFSIDDKTYNGEFLFDDSFRRINPRNVFSPNDYYAQYIHKDSFGNNLIANDYYAPVLGMQLNQSADILLNFKEFDNFAQQDKNFKIVITSDNPSIKINNDPSFEINSSNIVKYKNGAINVKFTKILQEDNKFSQNGILLYAEIPSLNKKIGLIECYCKEVVNHKVTLIYVRFSPKSAYPTYDHIKLQDYLNNNSFNQLFKSFTIDIVHLDAFVDTSEVWYKKLNAKGKALAKVYSRDTSSLKKLNDDAILDYLKLHMTGEYIKRIDNNIEIPAEKTRYKQILNRFNEDYYFITDINKSRDSTNSNGMVYPITIGGFHNPGAPGGAHLKVTKLDYGQTREELDAHEFGHWFGLQHVYEDNADYIRCQTSTVIRFTNAKGQSKNNFMDYNIKRKSWFKNQLINMK